MRDLFHETLALERIEMITRLVSVGKSEVSDKELVVDWVAELSADLLKKLDAYEESSHDA